MRSPRNQLLENSFTWHLQRIRINVTKSEETRIHFKSDVLLPPPCLMLNFHYIYETLWSVRNRIFSVRTGMVLLIASERFPESPVLHSFLVSKVEMESFPCTHNVRTYVNEPDNYNIVRRDNNSRLRTLEKNSGDTVRRLGTIIQSIFCAQSRASIRLTVWKWSGDSRYPGDFPPVFENARRAFSPDPTDYRRVPEDE